MTVGLMVASRDDQLAVYSEQMLVEQRDVRKADNLALRTVA